MDNNSTFIPIYRDFFIKWLLGTNKNIKYAQDFLESYLDLEPGSLNGLKIINSPKIDMLKAKQRKYEIDIKYELPNGELIDFEMQDKYDEKAEKRMLTYLNGIFYTKLNSGEDFDKLKKTMSLVLTRDLVIHKEEGAYLKYHLTNDNNIFDKVLEDLYEMNIIDVLRICEHFDKRLNKKFINWCKFIRSKNLKELKEASKLEPILTEAYKECVEFMGLEYVQNMELERKLDMMERQEDLNNAIKSRNYEIAELMLENTDLSLEKISICTNLSKKELEKLSNNDIKKLTPKTKTKSNIKAEIKTDNIILIK